MKFLETTKDGGAESTVWAHWLIELKGLFSVALLRFEHGTRDAYHSHAFDCVSWVLSGALLEEQVEIDTNLHATSTHLHTPGLRPIITRRSTFHRVYSFGRTWVLTFRGPWSKTWREAVPDGEGGYAERELAHGRREVALVNREQRIWDRQSLWSQQTFGNDADRGPEGALAHLAREVSEVQAAPKDLIEYADCWILLVDACRRAGFEYEDLLSAIEAKAAINRARTWSAPDADGVCVHVREDDADAHYAAEVERQKGQAPA
jgi:hypothetical protein